MRTLWLLNLVGLFFSLSTTAAPGSDSAARIYSQIRSQCHDRALKVEDLSDRLRGRKADMADDLSYGADFSRLILVKSACVHEVFKTELGPDFHLKEIGSAEGEKLLGLIRNLRSEAEALQMSSISARAIAQVMADLENAALRAQSENDELAFSSYSTRRLDNLRNSIALFDDGARGSDRERMPANSVESLHLNKYR